MRPHVNHSGLRVSIFKFDGSSLQYLLVLIVNKQRAGPTTLMVLTAWHKLGTQGRARASLRRLKPLIYRSGLRTYAESSGDPESHQSRPPTPKVYGATGFSMKYITRDVWYRCVCFPTFHIPIDQNRSSQS